MKTALSLLVLAVLLTPSLATAAPSYDYPADIRALLPDWIAAVEARARPGDEEKAWWPEAFSFLELARNASSEGRVRVAMFHLETHLELVLGNHLIEDALRFQSDAERRSYVLQQTNGAKRDAETAWTNFRAKMHALDGSLQSLQAVEKAIYAADIGLTSILSTSEFETYARDFPRQEGFPEGYVFALVRSTMTPIHQLGWATDLLEVAARSEGVAPRLVQEPWTNLTSAALAYGGEDPPQYAAVIDARVQPARENGEALLAVAGLLAEQRAGRANGMQTIFGDARSRGLDVVRDAARGMGRQLNNTTLEAPRAFDLAGVFTSDAIDRAILTQGYIDAGKADLGVVIVSWAALDHQNYVTNGLGRASPTQPPSPETPTEKGAPGPAAWALLAAAAFVAVLGRSRRR